MIATVKRYFIRAHHYARDWIGRMNASPKEQVTKDSEESVWDKFKPLPPEERKRLANWRIHSISESSHEERENSQGQG